jgi:phospholipase D1/2
MALIAEPGRSCWRRERADRVAFLVDAAAYFAVLEAAIANARESVFLAGWDIHSRLRLGPRRHSHEEGPELATFLDRVAKKNPRLRVDILIWDPAPIFILEREFLPLVQFGWRTSSRVHFALASDHPTGASHHQKIVVIDDRLAFLGGIDLTQARWDERSHRPVEPRRRLPDGEPYGPFHDVQLAVDGAAAAALGTLARERWLGATGEVRAEPSAGGDPWPGGLEPHLRDVDVAIARTQPAWDGRPEVREVEALFVEMIAASRCSIYVENQYLTAERICAALCGRLAERDGPEIVIVTPKEQSGRVEKHTMGAKRAEFVRRLRAADAHQRLRVLCPVVGDVAVNVHAKVMIVDDVVARVGSANLSDRSMGFDTECDAAVEAGDDEAARHAITLLRDDLLAEHLGVARRAVSAAVERTGSLCRTVDELRGGERTLERLEVDGPEQPEEIASITSLADPDRPFEETLARAALPPDLAADGGRWLPMLLLSVVLALTLVGVSVWISRSAWAEPQKLVQMMASLRAQPLGMAALTGAFALASLALVPLSALLVAVVLLLGPWQGAIVGWLGSLIGGGMGYAAGRLLWREAVRRLAGKRVNTLSRMLGRRGVVAVILVRVVPLAPFTVVNMVAGSSHVGFRDFLLGTAIGLAPGIALFAIASDRIVVAIQSPGVATIAAAAGAVLIVVIGLRWLGRILESGSTRRSAAGRSAAA